MAQKKKRDTSPDRIKQRITQISDKRARTMGRETFTRGGAGVVGGGGWDSQCEITSGFGFLNLDTGAGKPGSV